MRRILELTAETLRTGEARSKHHNDGGIWDTAIGLNPFISSDSYRFLLATTAAPTRIGSSQIADTPIAYALDPTFSSDGIAYILGDDGKFYKIVTGGTVTVVRPGAATLAAISNPTGGMAGIVDSGGNAYVFIGTKTRLLRWNLNTADDAAHWLDDAGNNLYETYHHPFHRHLDAVYFGNRNYLGRIRLDQVHNQATTLSNVSFEAARLGTSKETITALGSDGRYVIAAISPMLQGSAYGEARLIWYSGTGANWAWEVPIKGEFAVRAIIQNALGVFAITSQSIYQIAFGAQPQLVRTFASTDAIGDVLNFFSQVGRPNLASPFGDSTIFGLRAAIFGRRYPTEGITFSHPLQGHTGNISLIMPDYTSPHIYVGTDDDKLWKYDMSAAGNTSNVYPTRWIDLKEEFDIGGVEIEMPEGIGASDSITLTFEVPSGKTAEVTLSQSTIDELDRNYPVLAFENTIRGSKVRISVEQSAGTPRMGGIYLYGESVTR